MGSPSEKNSAQKTRKGKRTQRVCNINWSAPQSMSLPPPVSAQKGCKGRRTQRIAIATIVRQQLPAPQPVPQPLPPQVITTEEEDIELANNLVLFPQGGNLIDRAATGQLCDEEKDLQLAHNLILLSQSGNLTDIASVGKSSGTPTSQSRPPSTEMEKVSTEIEIGRQDTIVPSSQSAQSMARSTDTCNILKKKFNSPQAVGNHCAKCKKRKRESDALGNHRGFLHLDLNLPPPPDQDDTTQQLINGGLLHLDLNLPPLPDQDDTTQQPINGGFLHLDLNLPPPPDQDDTTKQLINGGFLHLDLNLPPPPDQDDSSSAA